MENIKIDKKAIITLVIAIVVLGAFYYASVFYKKTVSPEKEFSLPQAPVYSLHGVIDGINENRMTVTVSNIMGIDLPDNSGLRSREIILSDDTNIYKKGSKSEEEFRQEVEKYRSDKEKGLKVLPPLPSTQEIITIEDLVVGDAIIIKGASSEDLKNLLTIVAGEIVKK